MSLRKLSGAAAAGSREAYATTNVGQNPSSSTGGSGAGGATAGQGKAYSSHLAIQSDATKYRGKYKELKKKVRQIESENDRLHVKTLRIKRTIQRMRLERAILYERLEIELENSTNQELTKTSNPVGIDESSIDVGISQPPTGQKSPSPTIQSLLSPSPPRAQQNNRQEGGSTSGGRGRRNIEFSPSPEEERPAVERNGKSRSVSSNPVSNATTTEKATNSATTVKPETGRSSMKITLKRHGNSANNGSK